jgi:RNA polymerase sigma-70 factor (ECF subfamily)
VKGDLMQADAKPRYEPDPRLDEELMVQVARGDRAAFERLVDRHLGPVTGTASRILGSRSEGEDIAQEALLRVWTRAGQWRPKGGGGSGRFTTWLYRIVLNLAIDQKRKRRFAPLEEAGDPIDAADDSLAVIYRGQISVAVRSAIQRLPERQRAALVLCFFEGRTNAVCAEIMETTAGAVESMLSRARRTLRCELAAVYRELSGKPVAPDDPKPAGPVAFVHPAPFAPARRAASARPG